jgi:transcription initiation factor TFIID subunit 10
MQAAAKDKKDRGSKQLILTTEDLAAALKEYGVNISKQEYYADSPQAGTSKDKHVK